jgi:hypothetical protein
MNITPSLELILLLGGVLGLVGTWLKWVRPKLRTLRRETRAARDSLLGREAQHDSITGKEISPALPGMGQRMATIETALGQLVNLHERLDSHEKRLSDLEHMDYQRALARTESIEMLRTIDTAIRSSPKEK